MALKKGEERATRPCPILFRQQFQSTWYHDSIFCPTVWSSSQQEHRISVSSNHHHRRRRFTSTLFCYIIDNRVVVRVPVEYLRWIHLKPNPNPMMLIITNKSRRQMIFHPPDSSSSSTLLLGTFNAMIDRFLNLFIVREEELIVIVQGFCSIEPWTNR